MKAALALALLCPAAGAAAAPCASFRTVGEARIRYNPYEAGAVAILSVQVAAAGAGQVRFLLIDGDSARAGPPRFGATGPERYTLGALGDPARGFGAAGDQPTMLRGALAAGGIGEVQFQLAIPGGQPVRAGTHQQAFTVRYQCLSADGAELGMTDEQVLPLLLEVEVPAFAAATIRGSDRGEIDFGAVGGASGAAMRTLDIDVAGTLPYEVAVTTAGGAMLKRGPGDPAGIRYAMRYGDAPVVDGGRVLCPMPALPVRRPDAFAVTLDARDIQSAAAGAYSDTVTLSFTPRDLFTPTERCEPLP